MRLYTLAVVCAVLLALSVSQSTAQSLGDVARQEAERRKAVKSEGKVYTNKDLPDVPPATLSTSKPEVTATQTEPADAPANEKAEADGVKAVPEQQQEVRDQAYWSARMKGLQETLARDLTYHAALQSRISALTTDFVNRDDPAQRAVIAADRERAIAEFDRLETQIEADRKAIVDLQEQARRASVPPGWLR